MKIKFSIGVLIVLLIFLPFVIPSPLYTQSEGSNYESIYEEGRSQFKSGNLRKARDLFESVVSNADDSGLKRRAYYFLGRILKERGNNPIQAIKYFDTVLEGPIDYLTDDALFFVATIFINQLDQTEMALPYLKTINEHFEGEDYYEEAENKLNTLTEEREKSVRAYDPENIPKPRIQLNFEKVELKDFISAYSKMSGKSFIYRPNVQGKVTIVAPQGFPIYNLFNVFRNVLETRGYTAMREGDHYVVKSIDDAFSDGVSRERIISGLQTRLFDLEGLPWGDVKRIVKELLPNQRNLKRLKKFDQILVTTTPEKLDDIKKLLKDLKNIDNSVVFTYPPKHVRVGQLNNRAKSFLNSIMDSNSFDLIPLKNNNTLVVKAPRKREQTVRQALKRLDGDIVDRLNIKIINLEHANAEDITNKMDQLTNVLPGNFKDQNIQIVPSERQNAVIASSTSKKALSIIKESIQNLDQPSPQQPKEVRVFKLEHTSPQTMTDQLNQLSNLLPGDFPNKENQIIASEHQQAVVVSAASKKVFPTIKKIIERLDRKNKNTPDSIRVFPLKHADEEDVVDKLKKLTETLPGQISKEDLTIVADKRRKAVVVSAKSVKTLSIIERVLNEMDKPTESDSSDFHVYKVHNAKAGPLAEKLNFLVKDQVGEKIKITSDEQSNSLVISAPSNKFETLKPVIDQLDSAKKQILVDAYIIEASRDHVRRLGIEWTADGSVNNQNVNAGTNYGLRPQFQQGSLLGLSAGVFDQSGNNLVGVLTALSEESDFKILSTSHLVANENEEATLSVGSIVPILEDSQVTPQGSINRSFSFENVGVDLAMTPTLSGDSEVTLSIDQKIQELESAGQELGAPTRRTREINTRLSIEQDHTLVLGGVLSSQSNLNRQSVPYLKDIPLLSKLLSNQNNTNERRNLLIFLQPHVLENDTGAQKATERLRKKQKRRLESDTDVGFDELQDMLQEGIKTDTLHRKEIPDTATHFSNVSNEANSNSNILSDDGSLAAGYHGSPLSYRLQNRTLISKDESSEVNIAGLSARISTYQANLSCLPFVNMS